MPAETNGVGTSSSAQLQDNAEEMMKFIERCESGDLLRRSKHRSVRAPSFVSLKQQKYFSYHSRYFFNFLPERLKSVEICDLLEVRTGYKTDNLNKAARKQKFQLLAPEDCCFSVIFSHTKFLHKSVDFVAPDNATRERWVNVLTYLINEQKAQRAHFNEKQWLIAQFKRCDVDNSGRLTFDEIWDLLKRLNLQLSEKYAKAVFNESDNVKKDGKLNQDEFLTFFSMLTERPDLAFVLRYFSASGVESWTAKELHKFLTEEQHFADVTEDMAASILETFSGEQKEDSRQKSMGILGLRRLLQSRWGNMLTPAHDKVYQDMDQPLSNYYCNSSHNTYLVASQLKGEASIEGYITALRHGARLLELDVFDGPQGEPQITHKNTLITPLLLRHALESIKMCAFESSNYPVILTIENHVSQQQQNVMAQLMIDILGDQLYIPPHDADKRPLPSPSQLKKKFLIRGKRGIFARHEEEDDDEKEKNAEAARNDTPKLSSVVDSTLSSLMALPSVKLSANNIYADCKNHPPNGSPSLVESKALSLCESGAPLFAYTSSHFVKVYPKGLRQDSSNVHPVPLWTIGIQSVALNFQTAGDALDLNVGMFRINGGCGYVLKPEALLEGKDLRTLFRPKVRILVGIISAQYLPKPDTGRDIIDPYVSIQVHGIPKDEWKAKTRTIKDNGFNPVWNESFEHELICPEIALLRFVVKDFDSTSSNDFVGEYTIPVNSIRQGYSSIRLRTGYLHTVDTSATLFVRVMLEPIE